MVSSQEGKLATATEFYENLLGSAVERSYSLNLPAFHFQHQQDLSTLDTHSHCTRFGLLSNPLPPDKAPGLDGFTGRFYKSCWEFIKYDISAGP
jgi:hypothetical protein